MTQHYNKTSQKELRRFLRNHLSKSEAVMWKHLSGKQMLGYKFRRQYGVDQYVVDFYCPELKLAIEIDGESHFRNGAEVYDQERQKHIEAFRIRFLRFTNEDVLRNFRGVLLSIEKMIHELEAMDKERS